MKSIVARRAARGAALMDEVCPGWFNRIKLGDLDIDSFDDCILGQIYGSFGKGCSEIHIRRSWGGVKYGFVTLLSAYALERAWRREVEQRRAQDVFAHTSLEEQGVAMASV